MLAGAWACPGTYQHYNITRSAGIYAEYKECAFQFQIIVSDKIFNETVTISITIKNEGPYQARPVYPNPLSGAPSSYELCVTGSIDFIFRDDVFLDVDHSKSEIQYSIQNKNDSQNTIPSWLSFVAKFRRFVGKPSLRKDYFALCTKSSRTMPALATDKQGSSIDVQQELCAVDIVIVATDGMFFAQADFQILVYNSYPYIHQDLFSEVSDLDAHNYIQSAHVFRNHIGQLFEFNIPRNFYKDIDDEQNLAY